MIVLSDENTNTGKIAKVFQKVLGSQIKAVQLIQPDELQNYTLIGFGSGIFDQKHHTSLLEFVDNMPQLENTKVFIFSTSGISRETALKESKTIDDPHTPLREKLKAKDCIIVDEYNCAGFNDNSFLKFFGGMNKGKPNAEDIADAERFAESVKEKIIF